LPGFSFFQTDHILGLICRRGRFLNKCWMVSSGRR
jgi:hypothetical protein